MAIVVIHPSANERRGGIINAGLSYVEGLLAAGHQVDVWTASAAFAQGALELGAAADLNNSYKSFLRLCLNPRRLLHAVKKARKTDAFIHNNGRLWLFGCLIFPRRHFVVFHNESIGSRGFFRNWLSISEAQYGRLTAVARRRNLWVLSVGRILNGLSREVWQPKPLSVAVQKSPVVGFLAEIRSKKGLDVLLRAVAVLRQREAANFRLAIGGDGQQTEEYKQMSRNLGIADMIDWCGWVSDPIAFMDSIDVFCLPSRIEPFGIVVAEAMAREVPVVATRTDGPLELIGDSGGGLLVVIDDAEGLADALNELVSSEARRRQLGAKGRAYVESHFTPDAIGQRIETALNRASVAAKGPA